MTKSDQKSSPSFEESLKELEAIVARMEGSEQTLEQSLQDFEHGIGIVRTCQQRLTEAVQRVQQLIETNGSHEPEPFEPGQSDQ